MAVTCTTLRDVEMAVWAAWRGTVVMNDDRRAILMRWPLQGERIRVKLPRSGAIVSVRKVDVRRTYGFITIAGRTYS